MIYLPSAACRLMNIIENIRRVCVLGAEQSAPHDAVSSRSRDF